jgi:ubiquinone/menaquinone biosynthesis C-methylase UbiE
MKQKFGKSSSGILSYQRYLIEDIEEHIKNEKKFELRYSQLETRESCIICDAKITKIDFTRNTINFSLCEICGHLNGHNVLDEHLATEVYSEQAKEEIQYDKYYIQEKEEFDETVKRIYEPKAEFLAECLREFLDMNEYQNFEILDFGTGSGHMVKAFYNVGFLNVFGIDPMKSTIDFGKNVMKIKNLERVSTASSQKYISKTSAKIVSMICTLPHVTNPDGLLASMKQNSNIQFTFQKLPIFSLASMLDIAHPEINSRVISGTHTHIYTEESLKYIEQKYQMERVAEWRFGSDIIDLYRNLEISIQRNNFSNNLSKKFSEAFLPLIDQLQLTLDKNKFASEAHILWKFKR